MRRCKNFTSGLYCKTHRFQPFLWAFSVLSFIALCAGLYYDVFKPIKENLKPISLDISINPVLGKEIYLSEDSLSDDTSNIEYLSFDMEFYIANNNPTNANITDIQYVLIEGTEDNSEVFINLDGPFRLSRYSDDNLIDLPFFLQQGQSLRFYCSIHYAISHDLHTILSDEIKRINKDTIFFSDINNLFSKYDPRFNYAFIFNDKYKQYHQSFLKYKVDTLKLSDSTDD